MAKRGRPKLYAGELNVCIREDQAEELRRLSRIYGGSISELVRAAIDRHIHKLKGKEE
jgi:hypothetical protein